jgi:D-sedoheptulose 7-phosphate isomerase
VTTGALPAAALDLARTFTAGGRLIVSALDRPDHARHVAVEFVHPAITGAKSLPSFAVAPNDIDNVVRLDDALLIIESADHTLDRTLPESAQLLVVGADMTEPELVRWYHVLWELVQLGLEHPGLTGGSASEGGDPTNFLYPFLDAAEDDEPALLASMASSESAKQTESAELAAQTVTANAATVDAVAEQIESAVAGGGTVFSIGNGGSACDAAQLTRLLQARGLRAMSLAEDPATLTALANDLGVARIFSRQVDASVRLGDVVVLFSTSGSSVNLLSVLDLDVAAELVIVACAGYGGGPMAAHTNVDHQLIIDSTSVHRIQEAQGVLIGEICSRVPVTAPTEVHA